MELPGPPYTWSRSGYFRVESKSAGFIRTAGILAPFSAGMLKNSTVPFRSVARRPRSPALSIRVRITS